VVLAEIIGPDLLIILAIVALLFGGSQLPKFARSLGSAKREFEAGIREGGSEQGHPAETPNPGDEKVTMTRAELDALIAEREARGRSA
jgi:sec-independent protein translocase protein TatA